MTEKPDIDIADPVAPPSDLNIDTVHNELLNDPHYAVHMHERQLERQSQVIEEIAERLISLEKKVIDMEASQIGVDPNNPIADYPEVQMHQNR